jgi:hypothetical protein
MDIALLLLFDPAQRRFRHVGNRRGFLAPVSACNAGRRRQPRRTTRPLALHMNLPIFLSTIQVGITSVGILSGAIGETPLAAPPLAAMAERVSVALEEHAKRHCL